MRKKRILTGLALAVLSFAWVMPGYTADNTTVSIGISSWIGYGPIFIAQEKGFFKDAGANVKLHRIEKVSNRRSALATGAIVAFPTTPDTHVTTAAAGIPVTQVVALDDSYGADGLVAKKDITSIEDLKGKNVGLELGGGASFFWAIYLLDKHGMSLDDLNVKDMSAGAAGSAFAVKRLDAAFTWQPWLTTAEDSSFGHLVISSDETPGIIGDTLGFRTDFVEQHPEAVQAVVDGVLRAMTYIETNKDDAYVIMAKAMNLSDEDFAKAAEGVRYYDLEKNLSYFGTEDEPGPLYELCSMASKLLNKYGVIDTQPDISKLIDPQFIDAAAN